MTTPTTSDIADTADVPDASAAQPDATGMEVRRDGDTLRLHFPVLVVEGLDTGDGRYITPGGVSLRGLPVSLLSQPASSHGAQEPAAAEVIGSITRAWRRPGPDVLRPTTGEPFPEGSFVWSADGEADATHPHARLIEKGYLRGVSVDPADLVAELVDDDAAALSDNPGRRFIMHEASIAAATLVPIPAFGDAHVTVVRDDGTRDTVIADVDAIAAAGHSTAPVPSWRSADLDEECGPCAAGLDVDAMPAVTAAVGDPVPAAATPAATTPAAGATTPMTPPAAAGGARTSGMVALIPEQPEMFVVPGGDPADELHVTLAFLGDDVTWWDDERRQQVLRNVAQAAADQYPAGMEARIIGHAVLNPDGGPDGDKTPAAVYLLGDTPHFEYVSRYWGQPDEVPRHTPWLPHMTAGYGLDVATLTATGPVRFRALRLALAGEVTDFPLTAYGHGMLAAAPPDQHPAGGVLAALPARPALAGETADLPPGAGADGENPAGGKRAGDPQPCAFGDEDATKSLVFGDDGDYVPVCDAHETDGRDRIAADKGTVTEVVDITDDDGLRRRKKKHAMPMAAALLASAGPIDPPREWFDDPQLDGPTPLTITDDGRVYGHLAAWGSCHTSFPGACRTAPRSSSSYAYFRTGEVKCGDGTRVAVGNLTMDAPHAGMGLGHADTTAHYDHTGTVVANVAAGEDKHGIWLAGAMCPHVTDEQVARLRASAPSGDWRRIAGGLELVAALAVNVPGFPVPRALVAAGEPTALVAAGVLRATTDTPADEMARLRADLDDLRAVVNAERYAADRAVLLAQLDAPDVFTQQQVAAAFADLDDTEQQIAALLVDLDTDDAGFAMPPQLHQSYVAGEVAARIRWGTPGDMTRCMAQAKKHGMGAKGDGACAKLHHEVTGAWPGKGR